MGKVSQPLGAKAGKEATEKFFSDVMSPIKCKIVDLSEIAQNWMTTSWMLGLQPKRSLINRAPNSAAFLRVLVFREVDIFAFSTADFLAACKEKCSEVPSTTSEMEEAEEARRTYLCLLSSSVHANWL